MLPGLPSESPRLFVEKPFLEGPKLNSHCSIAIFYIPLRVMLVCLFRCILIIFSTPWKCSESHLSQEASFFGGVGRPGPSLLKEGGGKGSGKDAKSLPKAYMWMGKFSLFLATQRSWLASPPRTPNASFLVIILLSSFFPIPLWFCQCFSLILRWAWCPSSTLQASPGHKERGLEVFQVYGPL